MMKFLKQFFCRHFWVGFYKGGGIVVRRCIRCEKTKIERLENFIKKYGRVNEMKGG